MHEEVFSEQETPYTEGNRKIVHEYLQFVYTLKPVLNGTWA